MLSRGDPFRFSCTQNRIRAIEVRGGGLKIYLNTLTLAGGAPTHTLANSFAFTSSRTFGCACSDQTALSGRGVEHHHA